MSDPQQVNEAVTIVKRLQTFDLNTMLSGARKVPRGVVVIRSRDFSKGGAKYQRTEVSVPDEEALKALNLAEYAASPEVVKAGNLLQRFVSFDPGVIVEAKNYLPTGMIDMAVGGGAAMPPIGINININCKKLSERVYWPIAVEETAPFEEPG